VKAMTNSDVLKARLEVAELTLRYIVKVYAECGMDTNPAHLSMHAESALRQLPQITLVKNPLAKNR
jgi:hypothetical protein